ncbi:MAG: adenine phosphoribosyltransferase [Pseudomonadota bacterium]|nr:adenine phosphoribosyltransferase [Pseudomonadota bacterium]
MPIKSRIRTIPHYPVKGVMFRDITTLLKDPVGLRLTVEAFVERYGDQPIDKVAGIEARGFFLGAVIAHELGTGFVPIRKKGKLPGDVIGQDYQLEYGIDRIEVHTDAIDAGERVLLVDDLIATGGTAEAAIKLVEKSSAEIVECCFIVDLPDIGGRARLEALGHTVFALCEFEGD